MVESVIVKNRDRFHRYRINIYIYIKIKIFKLYFIYTCIYEIQMIIV